MNKKNLPGLYIHIPFCTTKCPYCDFYSETAASLIPAWLHAFEKEVLLYKDRFRSFDSLYVGGGTPSVLNDAQFTALMECISKHFRFQPGTEITIEVNPDDITEKKLRCFRELGVNRISMGVQSFDEQVLLFLKRRHTAHAAEMALDLIRSCGFANVGVDLMYGIPGQAEAGWIETLKKALSFQPEHISCYQLTVAEDTVFGEMREKGRIQLPDETESEAFFLSTAQVLEENGYLHYEISNFARGEEYCSRHNQKYWQHVAYLGLGPAAHSFQNGTRWWNYRSIEQYCQALEEGRAPVAGREKLSDEERALESLYLGLRTRAGVDLNGMRKNQNIDTVLPQLLSSEYVRVINNRIVPTRKGFLVADRLPLLFT